LARGPNVAKGYWKKPKETEEVFKPDGWFHTGDIGIIDEDGFLKITDRKKDLIKTAGGKYVAPQPIENAIKAGSPLISQAVVIGDARPYCVALITLNKDEVLNFAKAKGLDTSKSYEEIINDPVIVSEIQKVVDGVNSNLASFETIKKFRIIPQDFAIEDGSLTPTLKVKRKVIMERYKDIINEMYSS
jgi:long-chain acyl-CoA synthetase